MSIQIQLSKIGFSDIHNDIVNEVNGVSMPSETMPSDLPYIMPETFFFEDDTLGKTCICSARIDGKPLTISALSNNVPYTPSVDNYHVLFSAHPVHRPR